MRHWALMALIAVVVSWDAGTGEVRAQTDLNAGKTAVQMFASNCAVCHRSPAGLARGRDPGTVARFLLQHYTARPENAGAIANYIISVRGSGPAQRATNPDEAAAPPAAAPGPVARQRPLDKLATATVERLKTFASAADAAVPSDPNTPPRGVKQIEAYAATGTAAELLRQTAINAAMRQERGKLPTSSALPGGAAPARGGTPPDGTTAATGSPAAATADTTLQLRGPPASGAIPSRQSNDDQF